jgi:hypothetical protein
MPYTAPATVVTGTTIASTWGNAVKAATDYLANPPACRLWHNAAQATTSGARLALAFNSEEFDTDGMHDTATNNSRITINTAGIYVVHGAVEWAASNTTGVRQLEIRGNGSDATIYAIQSVDPAAAARQATISLIRKFAVGNYIQLTVFQSSGIGINIGTGSYTPFFAATWIGLG